MRAIANDVNSFQWKVNVAIRTLPHLLSSDPLSAFCFLLSPCSKLCRLLRLPSASAFFFFTIYSFKHSVLLLPSVGSALLRSSVSSSTSGSALVFLLCLLGVLTLF